MTQINARRAAEERRRLVDSLTDEQHAACAERIAALLVKRHPNMSERIKGIKERIAAEPKTQHMAMLMVSLGIGLARCEPTSDELHWFLTGTQPGPPARWNLLQRRAGRFLGLLDRLVIAGCLRQSHETEATHADA